MGKNPAAVALGRKGGKATAKKLTLEQRAESARNAAQARWAKIREVKEGATALAKSSAARWSKVKKEPAPKA